LSHKDPKHKYGGKQWKETTGKPRNKQTQKAITLSKIHH